MNRASLLSITFVLTSAIAVAAQTTTEPIHKPGNGVTLPVIVTDVKPSYTPDAMRRGVSGLVKLECIVETDGTVSGVRVVQPLDVDLDVTAAEALKQWRFKPGTREGNPVRVQIEVEMTFTTGNPSPRLDSVNVFKPGPGVTTPKVLKEVKPEYTPLAKTAGIQGTVTIDCVVLPDGRVGATRVTQSLGPDLDREALNALRQWRFSPGERQGKPVPVQISVTISFTLK
jgi:TonB family protein